jgi:hypothetical protein
VSEINETTGSAKDTESNAAPVASEAAQSGFLPWLRRAALPLTMVLALLILVAVNVKWFAQADEPTAATSPLAIAETVTPTPELITLDELENRNGLEVTLLAVTALGGLVDFRFRVLDEQKVNTLLSDENNMPMVMFGLNDEALRDPGGMHAQTYKEGKVYYFHYPNAGGKVKPGASMYVMFGEVVVGPILVQ